VAIKTEVFGIRASDLAGLGFRHVSSADGYLAEATNWQREGAQTLHDFDPRSDMRPYETNAEKADDHVIDRR
jgi:hypothetical protein